MKNFFGKVALIALVALFLTSCGQAAAPPAEQKKETAPTVNQAAKPVVYFTRDLSPAGLVKVYQQIKQDIQGKVAIKIHTGEPNGPNIIPREMVMALQQSIPDSKLVETNTLYGGARGTTARHRETLKINGWDFCEVDIMDEDGAIMLPVNGGRHFQEMPIAKNMVNYDSMVVLTHFKGHAHGGFGGSLKNIAIGCAESTLGKSLIHDTQNTPGWVRGERLMENMVESGKATIDYFGDQIVYINILRNMSVDCDCAGVGAAPVTTPDIGILASIDILAVDQASIDMVYDLPQPDRQDLQERIETRQGLRQLTYMKELGMGSDEYELVSVD